MKALTADRAERSTAIAALKETLIEGAMGALAADNVATNRVRIVSDLAQAFRSGVGEGAKVGLHRQIS